MNVADSSDIEKVIVSNCDSLAMIINRLKICKPMKFINHVLRSTKVCKPEGICIGGGRFSRRKSDTIRFIGDRRGFRCRWFDGTGRHMRMTLFAHMWVLVLMMPRRMCCVLVFWISGWRTVSVIRTVLSKVATLATLVTTCMPLMSGKLLSTLLLMFYSRRGVRRGGVRGSAFGEEGFIIGHL